jgi:hypothetical protein
MSGDFFDPTPEPQVVVLVQSATLRQAEALIESCEHCNEEDAQIPFDAFSTVTSLGDPCERRDQAMRQYYAGLVSFVGTIQDLQRLDDLALFHPRLPRAAAAPAR